MDVEILGDSLGVNGLRMTTIRITFSQKSTEQERVYHEAALMFDEVLWTFYRDALKSGYVISSPSWKTVFERWGGLGLHTMVREVGDAFAESVPRGLSYGEWHRPGLTNDVYSIVASDVIDDAKIIFDDTLDNPLLQALTRAEFLIREVSACRLSYDYDYAKVLRLLKDGWIDVQQSRRHVMMLDHVHHSENFWLNESLHGRFKGWVSHANVVRVEEWRERPVTSPTSVVVDEPVKR